VNYLYNKLLSRPTFVRSITLVALMFALVLVPSMAQAQTDCTFVDAGSGMGGWYDSNGQPCTPETTGGEGWDAQQEAAFGVLLWWNFVILFFIFTGVPL
jgi:hypothetical protein